jgi:hypothetical protein
MVVRTNRQARVFGSFGQGTNQVKLEKRVVIVGLEMMFRLWGPSKIENEECGKDSQIRGMSGRRVPALLDRYYVASSPVALARLTHGLSLPLRCASSLFARGTLAFFYVYFKELNCYEEHIFKKERNETGTRYCDRNRETEGLVSIHRGHLPDARRFRTSSLFGRNILRADQGIQQGRAAGDSVSILLPGAILKSVLILLGIPVAGILAGAVLGNSLYENSRLSQEGAFFAGAACFGFALVLAFMIYRQFSEEIHPYIDQVIDLNPATQGTIDPVCGMRVDPARAAAKIDYDGKTYFSAMRSA